MVLAYHGRVHSEGEIRQLLQTGPRGTPARNIANVASLGFEVEVKFSNAAELAAALLAGTPPIVYLDTGSLDYWSVDCSHVAVLVGMEVATVLLNDPAFDSAPQKAALANFLQAWNGQRGHSTFAPELTAHGQAAGSPRKCFNMESSLCAHLAC
jgi:ABC-type bacteriocin/lantibiotic exporter with double-glycine peptidase domain